MKLQQLVQQQANPPPPQGLLEHLQLLIQNSAKEKAVAGV